MANPCGNYPGRQIFLGRLSTGEPAFAYFGSGRSKGSQERFAAPYDPVENSIRIKPIDPKTPFDPFRHYQAIRIDPKTGIAVVSNSQAPVDAIFEYYTLGDAANSGHVFVGDLLTVIGPEWDSKEKPTSRIVGVVLPGPEDVKMDLAVTTVRNASRHVRDYPNPGKLMWVSTYDGNVEYSNFDPGNLGFAYSETGAKTAADLANEIYDISNYIDPKYGELRVWCVAGVRNGNGPGGWELARKNRHNSEYVIL